MKKRFGLGVLLLAAVALDCGGRTDGAETQCVDAVLASSDDSRVAVAADDTSVVWGTPTGDVFERNAGTTTLRGNVGGWVGSIALRPDQMFVTTLDSIYSIPRTTPGPPVKVGTGKDIWSIKASDRGVFYFEGGATSGTQRFYRLTASGPVLLLDAPGWAADFVLDGDDVYFNGMSVKSNGVSLSHVIARLRLTDLTTQAFATDIGAASIAVDHDWVYAGITSGYPPDERSAIVRISKADGSTSTVVDTLSMPYALALDGRTLYALVSPQRYDGPDSLLRVGTDGASPTELAPPPVPHLASLQVTSRTVVLSTWPDAQDGTGMATVQVRCR